MLNEGLGSLATSSVEYSTKSGSWRRDQGGSKPAKGHDTWELWGSTPGDVSHLSPSNTFLEPLYPGEPTGVCQLLT